jgi:hypothetical protein
MKFGDAMQKRWMDRQLARPVQPPLTPVAPNPEPLNRTKSATGLIVAAAVGIFGWFIVNQTTLVFNYTPSAGGPAMSPEAAHSFCDAGTFVLSGQTPPGCGQENGPLAFGYVLLVLGIIYAIAAIVRLAARGRSEVPPYRPSAL